jgi:hypothetical protein
MTHSMTVIKMDEMMPKTATLKIRTVTQIIPIPIRTFIAQFIKPVMKLDG